MATGYCNRLVLCRIVVLLLLLLSNHAYSQEIGVATIGLNEGVFKNVQIPRGGITLRKIVNDFGLPHELASLQHRKNVQQAEKVEARNQIQNVKKNFTELQEEINGKLGELADDLGSDEAKKMKLLAVSELLDGFNKRLTRLQNGNDAIGGKMDFAMVVLEKTSSQQRIRFYFPYSQIDSPLGMIAIQNNDTVRLMRANETVFSGEYFKILTSLESAERTGNASDEQVKLFERMKFEETDSTLTVSGLLKEPFSVTEEQAGRILNSFEKFTFNDLEKELNLEESRQFVNVIRRTADTVHLMYFPLNERKPAALLQANKGQSVEYSWFAQQEIRAGDTVVYSNYQSDRLLLGLFVKNLLVEYGVTRDAFRNEIQAKSEANKSAAIQQIRRASKSGISGLPKIKSPRVKLPKLNLRF